MEFKAFRLIKIQSGSILPKIHNATQLYEKKMFVNQKKLCFLNNQRSVNLWKWSMYYSFNVYMDNFFNAFKLNEKSKERSSHDASVPLGRCSIFLQDVTNIVCSSLVQVPTPFW